MTWSTDDFHSVVATSSPKEPERRRLVAKLRLMARLAPGWSFGRGKPVAEHAIRLAENVVFFACAIGRDADVFPNHDGGCAVTVYADESALEVSIGEDGELSVRGERGFGSNFDEFLPSTTGLDLDAVVEHIESMKPTGTQWCFASLISASTIDEPGNLETSSTRPLQGLTQTLLLVAEGGSQSSMPHARVAA